MWVSEIEVLGKIRDRVAESGGIDLYDAALEQVRVWTSEKFGSRQFFYRRDELRVLSTLPQKRRCCAVEEMNACRHDLSDASKCVFLL